MLKMQEENHRLFVRRLEIQITDQAWGNLCCSTTATTIFNNISVTC